MNTEKLINILQTQTTTYMQFRMFAYIIREIKSVPYCTYYIHNGNVYITKGNADNFPCIVAHMDTVHDIAADLTAIRIDNNITGFNRFTMKQAGIGGDDKVGIFIALESLRFFDCIKIAFFRDEETGCEGSFGADKTFFTNCNFILQCDRQGNADFITEAAGVPLASKKFKKAISHILNDYQYSFAMGLLTDVAALKQLSIGCSMANISCGYYNPHTDYEYVNIDDVEACLNMVKCIIMEIGNRDFPHTYTRPTRYNFFNYFKNYSLGLCRDCWAPDATSTGYCKSCNQYYNLEDDASQVLA